MSSKPAHNSDLKPGYIIGIDPGFTGAIAVYDPLNQQIIDIKDMPLKERSKLFNDSRDRSNIDVDRLADMLMAYAALSSLAVIERVSAAPNQGVVSMFRFGEGYGMLRGVLACQKIKVLTTPPAVWKSTMNLTHEKATAFLKCKKHFDTPTNQKYFTLAKHHGRAEAILLAMFGARSLGFQLQDINLGAAVKAVNGGDVGHIL